MTIWTPELSPDLSTIYEQIANALEADIANGRLKPGDRLPPQRKLAEHLSVTKGTVGRAYALAETRGLLSNEVGRGAFVTSPETMPTGRRPDGQLVIDLGLNLPPAIDAEREYETTLRELSRQRNLRDLFGAVPVDSGEHHRKAAAQWLAPRIDCSADDIVICTGTQSALVSTLATLTNPGDCILVEPWTFPGILTAAQFLGLQLIPVPVDDDGIIPKELKSRVSKAKALYTVPGNQNPTTVTISLKRRKAIAKIAASAGLMIIEDDVYGQLLPGNPPSLTSLYREGSFLICSLSKTMAVGLRLAFLCVPGRWRDSVLANFQASSFFPAPLSIEIATRWIQDGTANHFVKRRIETAVERQRIARNILDSGMIAGRPELNHLWLQVPSAWTGHSLQKAAAGNGVIVLPASAFAAGRGFPDQHIRISLGGARNNEELKSGLNTIARLLDTEQAPANAHY